VSARKPKELQYNLSLELQYNLSLTENHLLRVLMALDDKRRDLAPVSKKLAKDYDSTYYLVRDAYFAQEPK
jgi:hypothetical protein